MDPDPKITLSNFAFWSTSASDSPPPAADLKISFARNGEILGIGSPLKRCGEVWTDLGMGLMVPASGILVVDVLHAVYSVTHSENSDRTYSKLGSVYIDLGELLEVPENISIPAMHMSVSAQYTTTVVTEADHLPIMHCRLAVTRFSSFPVDESLSPLYLPFQICAAEISDADFKRYAEELEGFLGASDGAILLTVTSDQVAAIEVQCLLMRSYHDQIHLTALFAGLLNDQFLIRSRIHTHRLETDSHPPPANVFVFTRFIQCVWHAGRQAGRIPADRLLRRMLTSRYFESDDHNGLTRAIFFLETVERLRLHAYARDFVLDQFNLYLCMLVAYFGRYHQSNDILDIDKALLSADKAKKLSPPWWRHPEDKVVFMSLIADALASRYARSRDCSDMYKAKELVDEGLALSPRDSPVYLPLLQVSTRVLSQYCIMDETADCEPAILLHEELLSILPRGDRNVAETKMNLVTLYNLGGNLNRAIKMGRDFVDANPNHPDKDLFLAQLGHTLLERFSSRWNHRAPEPWRIPEVIPLEEQHDLNEAITLLSRIPLDNLHRYYFSLAQALFLRYEFGGNHLSDLRACISLVSHGATSPTESPLDQYSAADKWLWCAEKLPSDERRSSGMAACTTVMSIIPGLLWMGMGLQDRHDILALSAHSRRPFQLPQNKQEHQQVSIGQAPNRSAAFAIGYGEYRTAIEWLEQGRSIIWDQMLQLRIPLESLKLVDEQLADRLGAIGRELAISTARSGSWATRTNDAGKDHEVSHEDKVQKHRRLTHDWETGIAEARRLPGCEEFLAPKTFAYLSRAADDCTVVIINTDGRSTDALVLFPHGSDDGHDTDILHVPFPEELTTAKLKLMQEWIALTQPSSPERKPKWCPTPTTIGRTFTVVGDEKSRFEFILAGLWYEIVLPILVRCNQERPDLFTGSPGVARPRIRWCPTGPLSFLPLHAAGDYTASHTGHKVYDFVISSYIPTLSSIIRDNPPSSSRTYVDGRKPKILAVCCATPKGYPPIIGTQAELGQIKKHADLAGCKLAAVTEQDATADRILEEIKDAHWVHFACHGVQNTKNPTQSALILQNGTRATLSDFAALDLPHAELAYLSACQTATGYDAAPSESIHLAAGMLLAGFRCVIATMWPIQDRYAPDVADSVYGYLLRGEQGSTPDYKESAVALDLAVQRLREKVGETNFLSRVPYIHIGA